MTIRLMTIGDYDRIYEMWLNTPGMGLNNIDDNCEGIERFLKRNPSTCFIAEEEHAIIGVIMAGHDGRRGFIYHTAVLPQFRQRGIGKQLVERAMEALKAEGISKATLVVFARNKAGNAFWEKMGFTRREDIIYRNRSLTAIERIDT